MPECHQCPYNGKASKKCLSCSGASDKPNNHGRTHVSFENVGNLDIVPVAVHPMTERMSRLAGFMRVWLRLEPAIRDLLADMLSDTVHSQRFIAEKHGISPVLLQWRLLRLAKQFPELRSVLKIRMKPLRKEGSA